MKALLEALVALEKLIVWLNQFLRQQNKAATEAKIDSAIEQSKTQGDTSALEEILHGKK
jgi:hypothetical protein